MDAQRNPLAATETTRTDPSVGRDEYWCLLAIGEPSRFGGLEWLLDWVEKHGEDPR